MKQSHKFLSFLESITGKHSKLESIEPSLFDVILEGYELLFESSIYIHVGNSSFTIKKIDDTYETDKLKAQVDFEVYAALFESSKDNEGTKTSNISTTLMDKSAFDSNLKTGKFITLAGDPAEENFIKKILDRDLSSVLKDIKNLRSSYLAEGDNGKQYIKQSDYKSMVHKLITESESIMDSDLRMGSTSWCEFIQVAKQMATNEEVIFNENDSFLLSTDIGETAVLDTVGGIYEAVVGGKTVKLDSPRRTPSGDSKKFMVYVNSGRKNKDGEIIAKLIKWGDPNLKVKNGDPKASKAFRARHKCDTKTDRLTAGWWACNVHRYSKQLGLQSSNPW